MRKLVDVLGILVLVVGLMGFVPVAQAADDEAEEEEVSGEALSLSQTSYIGARLLKGDENVKIGSIEGGPYGDADSLRYVYWQGDTMFAGVKNPETGNKVDLVAEWYWFESSIPRNADFYVGVVKVKASPNPVDDWYLKEENGWYGNIMWPDDVVQLLEVTMDPSGAYGGLRWDWCVPFDSYKWEPMQNIEVESGYSAGFDAEGGFSEGGVIKDLSGLKANIQAKGYLSAEHKVSTHYTITLHKWQVLVSSGADNMRWQMRVLKGGNNQDSAYHEYFVVIQAQKGSQVWVPSITIAANFKHSMWWWFDGYEALSAVIKDVTFTPPPSCYVDDPVPAGVCKDEGVCNNGAGFCDPSDGKWACNYPEEYEATEVTCDGLDNDCDGSVDEAFPKLGMACDGSDSDSKKNGVWVCSAEGTDVECNEDPCAGVECGDGCGTCDDGFECKKGKCVEPETPDQPDPDKPQYDCNGITEAGQCDGNWLVYCAGGEIVEQYCAFCCAKDIGTGWYYCMPEDKCQAEECIPQCSGKECGPDGCGGVCGACDAGESCSDLGLCQASDSGTEDKNLTCGTCAEGWVCGANGQCVPGANAGRPADSDQAQAGCTASANGNASAALLLLAILGAVMASLRFARKFE